MDHRQLREAIDACDARVDVRAAEDERPLFRLPRHVRRPGLGAGGSHDVGPDSAPVRPVERHGLGEDDSHVRPMDPHDPHQGFRALIRPSRLTLSAPSTMRTSAS